ncbi:MAG: xanthine dehydrogenase family protein molybdopterin-binding subunit, partial [Myxococcales bacterium]|nr:xanthine dehydrogenase family protein molybdopterin-binding subunit [Myxococcales bacterium]
MAGETRTYSLTLGFEGALKQIKITTPADEPRPWDAEVKTTIVGKPLPRVDGLAKVTGAARYTHDINLPEMQHAVILRCPHPCAMLRALDLGPAEAAPGVSAVIPIAKVGDRLIFAGQDVAAVAAASLDEARAAAAAIKVTYEEQPFVVDLREAMKDDAPIVHPGAVQERHTEGDEPGVGGGSRAKGNIRTTPSMKKGDTAKALRAAKVRHQATYTTQVHTHSALETHSIVVRWDAKDKMTVWSSTQAIFSVRDELAEIFELSPGDVTVITDYLGGGFGAKFGASAPGSRIAFTAGELARKSGKPVSLLLDRREEHLCTGNRPDSIQDVTLGATPDGALTAIHVVGHGTAGVGTGAGIGRNAFGIYTRCPNIRVESADVFTNAGPGTAFRAPGHPQGAFAIEMALNELAQKLGQDPLALRIAHNEHPVRRLQFERGAEAFGWKGKRASAAAQRERKARVRTGVGVAASIWGDYSSGKVAVVTISVGR